MTAQPHSATPMDLLAAAVNDAPTLTATGATASFTEGGSAADLFSGISASTVETGQTFSGLTLTVSNVTDGAAELLTVDGTSVGLTNGNSGTTVTNSLSFAVSVVAGTATLTLSGGALSAAQLQTLVDALAYRNSSDDPTAGTRTVTLASVTDSGGTASGGVDTTSLAIGATVTVTAVNDDPTARDDALGTLENAVVTGSVFADNGNGVDIDIDGGTLAVTAVNGVAVSVGQQIALASGALLTLNANGTFSYDPNGAFNALAAAGSGAASGLSATDSFGYEISDGQGGTSSALATVTITGVDSAGDLVTGSAGNDVLNGGIGADTMIGGTGDDTYIVDDAGDVVVENAGEGQDVVYANASYVLAANIESLVLYGNGSINGTGNGAANYIFGNAFANVIDGGGGADVMIGSAGNDTYIVDHVDDVVSELAGEGDDTVQTSVNYNMHDHVEFLIMTGTDDLEARGNALANTITGNAGNNAIDGGVGTDVMAGGAGNDRYAVDNIFDRIVATAGNGDDTVYASVDHQLDAHVETLILTGTAVRGFGSDDDNQIFGNDQVNVLYGRGGSDYMLGGGGDDIFVITAETGTVDVIGDFTGAGVAGGDRLSFGGFGAGATVKQLSQTSFEVASADGLTVQQFILAGHDGTPLTADDYYFA
ncbi:Ig-like domain-containing protein [Aurantimonas sp. DM33-3]|uniref:beta strand repeat-containing protein n=1 Tax=Aurantimonas sp. DM33-3 TaxID=2766955 RepID=UPI0016521209|nr:Ig-like domain-containing protein [Aurantimonas sp. DM33-3]